MQEHLSKIISALAIAVIIGGFSGYVQIQKIQDRMDGLYVLQKDTIDLRIELGARGNWMSSVTELLQELKNLSTSTQTLVNQNNLMIKSNEWRIRQLEKEIEALKDNV